MLEDKKYYVYKMSGHYYTIDTKPVYEKVLFEGTEKECYAFMEKELKKCLRKKQKNILIL